VAGDVRLILGSLVMLRYTPCCRGPGQGLPIVGCYWVVVYPASQVPLDSSWECTDVDW
jgi:hypothetical protein